MDLTPRPLQVALAFVVVAGLACQDLPQRRGNQVRIIQQGALEDLNPADVAVAPIQLMAEGLEVPELLLREAVQEALLRRRYSPLALDYVDSRVTEAGYTYGELGENAVCQILVHKWDERYWDTGRMLDVDLEMRMIDPRDPEGPALWVAQLPYLIDVTSEEQQFPGQSLYRHAVRAIATELVSPLPRRRTDVGRR